MPPHEAVLTNFFRNCISNSFYVLVSRAAARAEACGGPSARTQQRDSGRRPHWRIAARSDGYTRRPSHCLDHAEQVREVFGGRTARELPRAFPDSRALGHARASRVRRLVPRRTGDLAAALRREWRHWSARHGQRTGHRAGLAQRHRGGAARRAAHLHFRADAGWADAALSQFNCSHHRRRRAAHRRRSEARRRGFHQAAIADSTRRGFRRSRRKRGRRGFLSRDTYPIPFARAKCLQPG